MWVMLTGVCEMNERPVAPFQGCRKARLGIPRALPWADVFEPFGLKNVSLQLVGFDCFVQTGSGVDSLKGCNKPAQGNALGPRFVAPCDRPERARPSFKTQISPIIPFEF